MLLSLVCSTLREYYFPEEAAIDQQAMQGLGLPNQGLDACPQQYNYTQVCVMLLRVDCSIAVMIVVQEERNSTRGGILERSVVVPGQVRC